MPETFVTADAKQKGKVLQHLEKAGAKLELRDLEVGDFLIGEDVAVATKSGTDFILNVVDGSLLDNLNRLRANYSRVILVVEGDYFTARFHQTAFDVHKGIAKLTGLGIPVLYSAGPEHTGALIYYLAEDVQHRPEGVQDMRTNAPAIRFEAVQYLLEGLPGVGAETAERLYKHFGTALAVFNASSEELTAVEGIDEAAAKKIRRILETKRPG